MSRGNLPRSAADAVMRWIPAAARGLTSPLAAPSGMKRSRLFRKYVGLFAAVVCVALLTNGAFEVWFYYRDHKASLIHIQHEQADAAADKIGRFIGRSKANWVGPLKWRRPRAPPNNSNLMLHVCSAKYPPSPNSYNSMLAAMSSCVFRALKWTRLAAMPIFPTTPAS